MGAGEPDVNTEQKLEQKGEEATILEVKIFQV